MNSIKIILMCLFVACSCNKGEYPSGTEVHQIEEVQKVVNPMSIEQVADTTVTICDSQLVQETKIDSFSTIDTNYRTEKRSKSAKKSSLQEKDSVVVIVNEGTCSGCMGLSGNPRTTDEAASCAMYQWEIASGMVGNGTIDSAYLYCKRALSLYENGSLFFLKAKILNLMGNAAAALEAASISLEKRDHWRMTDREQAQEEKCTALTTLYNKYPSSKIHERILRDCAGIGK